MINRTYKNEETNVL